MDVLFGIVIVIVGFSFGMVVGSLIAWRRILKGKRGELKIETLTTDMDKLKLYRDVFPEPLPLSVMRWIENLVSSAPDFDIRDVIFTCVTDSKVYEVRIIYPNYVPVLHRAACYEDAVLWAADVRFWMRFFNEMKREGKNGVPI